MSISCYQDMCLHRFIINISVSLHQSYSFFIFFDLTFLLILFFFFFFSSRRRHTRSLRDWSSDVCSSDLSQMFTSLFCGILDTRTGEITYSNGGHNPPYHLSRAGVQQVPKTGGRVLGLLEETTYAGSRLVLGPGETLLLYTDGVTEALDPAEQFFSERRLESILTQINFASARQQIEYLTREITLFAAGAEQADDITTLAIRFLGPAGSNNGELQFTLKNRIAEIAALGERLGEFAAVHQLTPNVLHDLNLALE